MAVLQSRDGGYSQLFASVRPWRVRGQSRSAGYTSGTSAPHDTGDRARSSVRAATSPGHLSTPASIPPAPPGNRDPRAEGTGDTDSHGHSTAPTTTMTPRLHPPPHSPLWPRSCEAKRLCGPEERPRKGAVPAALSPLHGKASHSHAKQDKGTGAAPGGAGPPNGWDTGWGRGDPRGTRCLMLSCAIPPAPALPPLSQWLHPWKWKRVPRQEGTSVPFRKGGWPS